MFEFSGNPQAIKETTLLSLINCGICWNYHFQVPFCLHCKLHKSQWLMTIYDRPVTYDLFGVYWSPS